MPLLITDITVPPTLKRKRQPEPEVNGSKKQRKTVKKDGRKGGTPKSKGDVIKNKPQGSKEDGGEQPRQNGKDKPTGVDYHPDDEEELFVKDDATEEDDYPTYDDDLLFFLDPRLRKWDRDHDGSGDGNAGNGSSGLGDQILSSNVIAATS